MNNNSFRFKLGDFEFLVLSDQVSKVTDSSSLHSSPPNSPQPEPTMDLMGMFINTKRNSVLIDTGLGIGADPNSGKLVQNLENEGIECQDIDTVVFSHGHGDHVGGSTDTQGRPTFPNARYIMYRKEWEFWTSEPDLTQVNIPENIKQMLLGVTKKNLLPIQHQFNLIDEGMEIVPGIEFLTAPGHTPHHIVLVISSGSEQLFYIGDMLHFPSELSQPNLYSPSDMLPEQAMCTNFKILSLAVKSNALVFASHFPFPGLGYVMKKGAQWFWEPVKR